MKRLAFWKIPRPAQSLVLQPGDTLILRYSKITAQEAATIRERLGRDLKILIVQADEMGVKRDG